MKTNIVTLFLALTLIGCAAVLNDTFLRVDENNSSWQRVYRDNTSEYYAMRFEASGIKLDCSKELFLDRYFFTFGPIFVPVIPNVFRIFSPSSGWSNEMVQINLYVENSSDGTLY